MLNNRVAIFLVCEPCNSVGKIDFDLSKMTYSRRQKMLASNLFQEEEVIEEVEEGEKKEKTFNLMKMQSQSVRGWWKVNYYDKKTSKEIESVRV